jgi:hypothetical protein
MEYSLIKNNQVLQRIVSDRDFADKIALLEGCTVSDSPDAKIGFTKVGNSFKDLRPQAPILPPQASKADKILTKLIEKGVFTQSEVDDIGAV